VTAETDRLRLLREAGPVTDANVIAKMLYTGRALDVYAHSPLHMAALTGDAPALRRLLQNPAQVLLSGTRDEGGLTPCHHAAVVGRSVNLRLRARSAAISSEHRVSLIDDLAGFLSGVGEDGSDAHDALVAWRDAAAAAAATDDTWPGASALLWTELEEEAQPGLTPGVWINVQAHLMPDPAVAVAAAEREAPQYEFEQAAAHPPTGIYQNIPNGRHDARIHVQDSEQQPPSCGHAAPRVEHAERGHKYGFFHI